MQFPAEICQNKTDPAHRGTRFLELLPPGPRTSMPVYPFFISLFLSSSARTTSVLPLLRPSPCTASPNKFGTLLGQLANFNIVIKVIQAVQTVCRVCLRNIECTSTYLPTNMRHMLNSSVFPSNFLLVLSIRENKHTRGLLRVVHAAQFRRGQPSWRWHLPERT